MYNGDMVQASEAMSDAHTICSAFSKDTAVTVILSSDQRSRESCSNGKGDFIEETSCLRRISSATGDDEEGGLKVAKHLPDVDICPELTESTFCPSQITQLDLSQIEVAKREIFRTGCIPKWICNFERLETLKAPKLGIIIIEPWILELRYLKKLNLDQNQISTWPHFLRELPDLQQVSLDGNPCLEKAFDKSPTLRARYFNWNANSVYHKSAPTCIRGREWPPAASARCNNGANLNGLGFYYGGLYAFGAEPDVSNDGLLTSLEPDPLFSRLQNSCKANPSGSPSAAFSSSNENPQLASYTEVNEPVSLIIQRRKQTLILREMFDDIDVLLKRHKLTRSAPAKGTAQLVGSLSDAFNQLLTFESDHLSHKELVAYCRVLLTEEKQYLDNLKTVCHEFLGSKIKSSSVSGWLGMVFEGFTAMSRIHTKWILPSLKFFLHVSELSARAAKYGRTTENYGIKIKPRPLPEISEKMIELLMSSFEHLERAKSTYAMNIWRAVYLLDMPDASTRLYEDPEFETYTRSQMSRLGNTGGHLTGTFAGYTPGNFSMDLSSLGYKLNVASLGLARSSSTLSKSSGSAKATASLDSPGMSRSASSSSASVRSLPTTGNLAGGGHGSKRSSFRDQQLQNGHSLSAWVEKQLQRSPPKIPQHPGNFVYLPLVRLVRYERFFTSLYRLNSRFAPIVHFLRKLRHSAATSIEEMRTHARCNVLSLKFKTSCHDFDKYQWDAVLAVKSRSYFQAGILSKKTSDVIDVDGNSVSFVKEAFTESRMRILRLVCCGSDILVLDEVFEHLICRVPKAGVLAFSTKKNCQPQEVRVLFVDAKETCIVEVKDFKAKYRTHLQYHVEFIDACRHGTKHTV